MKEKTFRQAEVFLIIRIIFIDIPLLMFLVGFFTLPIRILNFLNAKLILKEKTILLQKGVLSKSDVEIPYSKINTVSIKQDLIGNLFSYGDIVITTGNDVSGIPFAGVSNPQHIRQLINNKLV